MSETCAMIWLKSQLTLLNLKLVKVANDRSIVVIDSHDKAFIIEWWSILSTEYNKRLEKELKDERQKINGARKWT